MSGAPEGSDGHTLGANPDIVLRIGNDVWKVEGEVSSLLAFKEGPDTRRVTFSGDAAELRDLTSAVIEEMLLRGVIDARMLGRVIRAAVMRSTDRMLEAELGVVAGGDSNEGET